MRYLYRRLVFYPVALWAAVTLNFAIPRLMPGNPAEVFLAAHYQQFQGDPHALQTIEAVLGVSHDPMPVQYGHYLLALVHGDLGISTSFYPARVSTVIAQSLPWTIFLVGFAAIIAFVLGTGLGIITAWRRGGFLDSILPPITAFAMALGFLVGGQVLVEFVFSYPGVGYTLATAVGNEDYPLVQALLLIITVAVLVANLAADLVYVRLDPRVRSA